MTWSGTIGSAGWWGWSCQELSSPIPGLWDSAQDDDEPQTQALAKLFLCKTELFSVVETLATFCSREEVFWFWICLCLEFCNVPVSVLPMLTNMSVRSFNAGKKVLPSPPSLAITCFSSIGQCTWRPASASGWDPPSDVFSDWCQLPESARRSSPQCAFRVPFLAVLPCFFILKVHGFWV